jgi:phosphotransferase system HPr (HPr) family protein
MEVQFNLNLENGLHARPAGLLAKTASQFKSQIWVCTADKKVNAKSVLSVMSLGLTNQAAFRIEALGEDEAAALQTLVQLIENNFQAPPSASGTHAV